jgi:hypothetical protein
VTYSWVEADFLPNFATEQGERPYRHRYKFRFEWCHSQGDPWFTRPYDSPFGWSPQMVAETIAEVSPTCVSTVRLQQAVSRPSFQPELVATSDASGKRQRQRRSCIAQATVDSAKNPYRSFGVLGRPRMKVDTVTEVPLEHRLSGKSVPGNS